MKEIKVIYSKHEHSIAGLSDSRTIGLLVNKREAGRPVGRDACARAATGAD